MSTVLLQQTTTLENLNTDFYKSIQQLIHFKKLWNPILFSSDCQNRWIQHWKDCFPLYDLNHTLEQWNQHWIHLQNQSNPLNHWNNIHQFWLQHFQFQLNRLQSEKKEKLNLFQPSNCSSIHDMFNFWKEMLPKYKTIIDDFIHQDLKHWEQNQQLNENKEFHSFMTNEFISYRNIIWKETITSFQNTYKKYLPSLIHSISPKYQDLDQKQNNWKSIQLSLENQIMSKSKMNSDLHDQLTHWNPLDHPNGKKLYDLESKYLPKQKVEKYSNQDSPFSTLDSWEHILIKIQENLSLESFKTPSQIICLKRNQWTKQDHKPIYHCNLPNGHSITIQFQYDTTMIENNDKRYKKTRKTIEMIYHNGSNDSYIVPHSLNEGGNYLIQSMQEYFDHFYSVLILLLPIHKNPEWYSILVDHTTTTTNPFLHCCPSLLNIFDLPIHGNQDYKPIEDSIENQDNLTDLCQQIQEDAKQFRTKSKEEIEEWLQNLTNIYPKRILEKSKDSIQSVKDLLKNWNLYNEWIHTQVKEREIQGGKQLKNYLIQYAESQTFTSKSNEMKDSDLFFDAVKELDKEKSTIPTIQWSIQEEKRCGDWIVFKMPPLQISLELSKKKWNVLNWEMESTEYAFLQYLFHGPIGYKNVIYIQWSNEEEWTHWEDNGKRYIGNIEWTIQMKKRELTESKIEQELSFTPLNETLHIDRKTEEREKVEEEEEEEEEENYWESESSSESDVEIPDSYDQLVERMKHMTLEGEYGKQSILMKWIEKKYEKDQPRVQEYDNWKERMIQEWNEEETIEVYDMEDMKECYREFVEETYQTPEFFELYLEEYEQLKKRGKSGKEELNEMRSYLEHIPQSFQSVQQIREYYDAMEYKIEVSPKCKISEKQWEHWMKKDEKRAKIYERMKNKLEEEEEEETKYILGSEEYGIEKKEISIWKEEGSDEKVEIEDLLYELEETIIGIQKDDYCQKWKETLKKIEEKYMESIELRRHSLWRIYPYIVHHLKEIEKDERYGNELREELNRMNERQEKRMKSEKEKENDRRNLQKERSDRMKKNKKNRNESSKRARDRRSKRH